MNKSELKGYKNFETCVPSLIPGVSSNSPIRTQQPSPSKFRVKHFCAPPLTVDNSMKHLETEVECKNVKPPF